jgi:hypothetical protein
MSFLKLKWVIAALLVLVSPSLGWAGQAQPPASPFKGEYFITRNADDICVSYTRNLNQFRRLDFNVCNPRLSEKYPEFTRPVWEEIPFDLGLGEKVVKNLFRNPADPGAGERGWQAWLTASEPLRAEGKIKLWRTRIDIDGDGGAETIIRLDRPLAPNGRVQKPPTVEQNPCPYRNNILYMLDSTSERVKEGFNRSAVDITDIIHFSGGRVSPGQSNGYYATSRLTIPAYPDGERIGATRGMFVYALGRWGPEFGGANVCSINWVPTGHYRPLKRSPTRR